MYFDNNLKKISVVIPTLQKKKDVLINLIENLLLDNSVGEVIIIDNSCSGLNIQDKKLRILEPKQNLYVIFYFFVLL